MRGFTTRWQWLEKGVITGCTVSVILFTAALNLLVKTVEKPRRGAVLASSCQQAPIKAFMDDLTIRSEGWWILEDLCKIIVGARMVQSLVLRKGLVQGRFRFRIGEEFIPTVSEKELGEMVQSRAEQQTACEGHAWAG